jgi:hypothetical protein
VQRIDLIIGQVSGMSSDRGRDQNPTASVVRRYSSADWTRDGAYLVMSYVVRDVQQAMYLRVRGTNGNEMEPTLDPRGENPWSDLWFYANPIFFTLR